MSERYQQFFRRSIEDLDAFWAEQAEGIHWHRRWDQVLDYSRPSFSRWFVDGETNISYNRVDRHPEACDDQTCYGRIRPKPHSV